MTKKKAVKGRPVKYYVGQFSFQLKKVTKITLLSGGDFVLIVQASSVEEADGKFYNFLEKMEGKEPLKDVENIWVNTILELPMDNATKPPTLALFSLTTDNSGIHCSIPEQGIESNINSFEMVEGDNPEPFITWKKK